jgi:hypothetical protein
MTGVCPYCGREGRLQPGPLWGDGDCDPFFHCYEYDCREQCPKCAAYLKAIRFRTPGMDTGPQADGNRIVVYLTPEEIRRAEEIGMKTQEWAIKNKVRDQPTANPKKGFRYHDVGAVCELAASKALAQPWNRKIGDFKRTDVGPYEVRGNSRSDGRLRLNQKGSKPEKAYILVLDSRPKFILAGWAFGYEVMQDKYWGFHYDGWPVPCWGMPQEDLHPMPTLPTGEGMKERWKPGKRRR